MFSRYLIAAASTVLYCFLFLLTSAWKFQIRQDMIINMQWPLKYSYLDAKLLLLSFHTCFLFHFVGCFCGLKTSSLHLICQSKSSFWTLMHLVLQLMICIQSSSLIQFITRCNIDKTFCLFKLQKFADYKLKFMKFKVSSCWSDDEWQIHGLKTPKNWTRGNRKTLKRLKMKSKMNFRNLKLKSHEEYLICRTYSI